jgi:hypothetical protein
MWQQNTTEAVGRLASGSIYFCKAVRSSMRKGIIQWQTLNYMMKEIVIQGQQIYPEQRMMFQITSQGASDFTPSGLT